MSVPREWVRIEATEKMIDFAKKLREQRDTECAHNVFERQDSDWPWVGELGECAVQKWIREHGTPHQWLRVKPIGQPDFNICGETVDVKCSKRKDAFKPHYEVGITGHHADAHHAETLLFSGFEIPTNTIVILGVMAHDDFLAGARYFGPGEEVHPNFTVREGSNLYNVHIAQLSPPLRWLEEGF